jgi:hypothetical protein
VSSMPKMGKRSMGKMETTPKGMASFVQSVTRKATKAMSVACWVLKPKPDKAKNTPPMSRATPMPFTDCL